MHASKNDPALAARLAEERRLGGLARVLKGAPALESNLKARAVALPKADFRSQEGIRALLEATADAVLGGAIAASQANSVAQLAGAAMRLYELTLDAEEVALAREAARTSERRTLVVQEGRQDG